MDNQMRIFLMTFMAGVAVYLMTRYIQQKDDENLKVRYANGRNFG